MPRPSPAGRGWAARQSLDELVVRLYQEIAKPMVFDADALNALATDPEALAHPGGPRILTPHPGEFARLIGKKLDGDGPQRRRRAIGGPLQNRGGAQGPPHAGDRRPTPGNQHDGQSGHGHRRLGRRVDRTDYGAAVPKASNRSTPPGWASTCTAWPAIMAAKELGQVSVIASDLIRYLPRAFLQYEATTRP